ncbi:glycoside hydrolase family 99-like domain-containing protein [Pedobacter fastidiosus]|nr:glycoside hydrolase family 99-like domain-containing protein [Pedobacter fastidiosus]
MKHLFIIGTIAMLFLGCKKEDQHLPPDFNYPIPAVQITENVNVGAYYTSYTAADWAKKYTYTPLQGEYNSLLPAPMDQNRQWADLAGLDFFIFNWNGTASSNPLLSSFVTDRKSKVKMVINYNIAHLSVSNTAPLTGGKLITMISELNSLATTHFSKDYYFQINGKPVILITPLNLAASATTSVNYTTVIPEVRAALKASGFDVYIVGEITSGWLPPQRYAQAAKAVDAVNLSNWSTSNYDQSVFFNAYSDQNWKNWTDSTSSWKVDFVPCIFPGFNDKVSTPASKLYNLGRTADFYNDYCSVAKSNMSAKRLVIINSWNNFQMGTSLEPTKEYGTSYLEMTRKQFKIN